MPWGALISCVVLCVGVMAAGSSTGGGGDCLADAAPPSAWINLIKDPLGSATPMPLQILSGDWLSALVLNNILNIIVTEVMGINSTVTPVPTAPAALYAAAGCTTFAVINDRGCPEVMPAHTDFVVLLELWYFKANINLLERTVRGFVIDDLGSTGYPGIDSISGVGAAQSEAYAKQGLPLEYFKSYNASWTQAWKYFPNMSAIEPSRLMPCSNGNLANNGFALLHVKFTQDVEGTEEGPDGATVYKCWDGFWWRSPACRNTPERCIPVIAGGTGWFVDAMAMYAAAYNMPMAIAITSSFANYLALPRMVGCLFNAWKPDPQHLDLDPFAIAFPTHDPFAWSLGDKRTGAGETRLKKIASVNLGTQYPSLRQLVRNIYLSTKAMDDLLRTWKVDGGTRTAREEACRWMRENERTWRGWLPDSSACIDGMGLVDVPNRSEAVGCRTWRGWIPDVRACNAGIHLVDVFNRSEAVACRWCPAGKRSEPLEDSSGLTRVCKPCPPGQHSELPGQLACSPCSPGTFSGESGTVHCQKCSPGLHADQAGQTRCEPCSPGSVSASSGLRHCTACVPGTWQALSGNTSCELCPLGFFQAEPGSPVCTDCNDARAGSSSLRGASSAAECECRTGSFQRDQPAVCEDCASRAGLNCTGGSAEPLQLAGYWVQVLDAARRDYSVFRCRSSLECPAGQVGACAAGRVGKACNSCADGHYPLADGRCQACNGASAAPLITLGVFGVVAVIGAAVLVRIDASTQRLTTFTIFVTLGQLTTALQTLGTLHQLSLSFVHPAKSLLRILSLLTFDLGPLRGQCFFQKDDPILMFSAKLLVLPALATSLLLLGYVSRMVKRAVDWAGILNAIGLAATVFFISMTLSVLMPLQCRRNPNGSFSMLTEPGVECFGSREHWVLASLAVLGILTYPVATLSWAVFATLRYPALSRTHRGLKVLKCQTFFFGRFRAEKYYFGLVLLVRNALTPLIPVALVSVPEVQCLTLCLVLQVPLCLEAMLRPWRTPQANRSALITNVILVMAVVSAAPILDVSTHSVEVARLIISWCALICVVLILGSALAFLAASMYFHCRRKKQYGAFICHHKAGAGALARQIKMLLQYCTTSRIFLDSDELDDLERLFDTVRSDTRNLVVLLSGDVLQRVWCAGEIATACRNSVKMIPLAFDGFQFPPDLDSLDIFQTWTDQDRTALRAHGISKNTVHRAYTQLRDQPVLRLLRTADLVTKTASIQNLASCCGLTTRHLRALGGDYQAGAESLADIFILGSLLDKEALASCEILQMMLQENLLLPLHVMRGAGEQHLQNCTTLLVVLTQGLLQDAGFAEVLFEVVDAVAEYNGTVQMIPLLADKYFQFPTNADYERLREGIPGLDGSVGPRLVETYRELFSTSAEPFSPLGSEAQLKTEVAELCRRRFPPVEAMMGTCSSSRPQLAKSPSISNLERAQESRSHWAIVTGRRRPTL